MTDDILPINIEVRKQYWCTTCNMDIVDNQPRCPFCNDKDGKIEVLGVHVKEMMGVRGRTG